MTFAIGLIVGLSIGVCIGVLFAAMLTAGKISDLQDRLDRCETGRLAP